MGQTNNMVGTRKTSRTQITEQHDWVGSSKNQQETRMISKIGTRERLALPKKPSDKLKRMDFDPKNGRASVHAVPRQEGFFITR